MKRRGLELVPEIHMRTADLAPIGQGRRMDKTHVSWVLKEMKQAAGENVTEIEGETRNFRAQLGFLLERALEKTLVEWAQVETEEGGMLFLGLHPDDVVWQLNLDYGELLGTPDGLDIPNNRLVSVKLTWRSARKWEEDYQTHFRWWLMQEMAYAKMAHGMGLVKEPILDALYIVGFVNGDYKGPRRLGVWTDLVTFEPAEVEDAWQAIQNYRVWMESREEE